MERPRIVHFIPSLEQGGAERMLVEIANSDPAHEHFIVTLLAGSQFFTGRVNGKVLGLGPQCKLLSLLVLPISIVRAMLVLRSLKPQWTVGWLYYGCLFACLGKFVGAKVLWSLHATELQGALRYWLARGARELCGVLSGTRWTDCIQYCSDASRISHERRGFSTAKSVVVHNSIDTDLFVPSRGEPGMMCVRSRFAAEPRDAAVAWIGCIARFEAQKDHESLLRSLRLLKQRGVQFRCVFAGRNCARDHAAFARLIARYDCADIAIPLGTIDNVAELYRAFNVLVLSSSYGEAMPLVLLEAIASGCPVVATDVGSNREIVGAFGAIVPPKSPAALADAIERTLSSPVSASWRERAHAYISETHGKSRLIRVWQDLIAQAAPAGTRQDLQYGAGRPRAAPILEAGKR
jgi:glycosyltransferase involved in cell wall biosynthesis